MNRRCNDERVGLCQRAHCRATDPYASSVTPTTLNIYNFYCCANVFLALRCTYVCVPSKRRTRAIHCISTCHLLQWQLTENSWKEQSNLAPSEQYLHYQQLYKFDTIILRFYSSEHWEWKHINIRTTECICIEIVRIHYYQLLLTFIIVFRWNYLFSKSFWIFIAFKIPIIGKEYFFSY